MHLAESGSVLFSPSDLVSFLECRHSSLLSRLALSVGTEKAKDDASLELLKKKGIEHERAYLARLREEGGRIIEIPDNIDTPIRVERSLEAMREGAEVIYQAAFSSFPWIGYADFLIKIARPSTLGDFSYEALDTKLARNPGPKHIIQLCAYSDFLTQVQGFVPEQVHLFLGNGQKQSFKLSDFYAYYTLARKRFDAFQEECAAISSPSDVSCPMPCGYCDLCSWRDVCAERWEQEDHLSLVANIRRVQMEKLQQFGLGTLEQLATAPRDTKVPDMQPETFAVLRSQASLQLSKRMSGESKIELLPQEPGRGFTRLPRPDAGDLFFDMEGDPYYPDGLEYLFGVYFAQGKDYTYLPFWGHDHKEELEAFNAFMTFVAERLSRYPQAHIYHYSHYEPTALKRLACRYAMHEEQLDNLLRQQKFVDLYKVVRESMRVSEPGYSIKDLEVFYLPKRENVITSASDSVVMYNRWRELDDPALLREIANYNEVDCVSTCKLHEWLLKQRPSGTAWAGENDDVAPVSNERKPWEIEFEKYRERILAAPCGKEGDAFVTESERSLLTHLLEFHRRDAKPQWWSRFARQDKLEDELLDDSECIACMHLQGEPKPDLKSALVYAYRFPSQEYKIKVNDTVVNVTDMEEAGTVIALDDNDRTLQIRRIASKPALPDYMHIGPQHPYNTGPIRNALYRFADSILADPQRKRVGREIMRRSLPCVTDKQPGAPIITGADVLAESIEAVAGLQDSYLFIQGPPGTGKTHTCSRIIVELISRGYKVGVSSNSHKAIHNLLQQVEKVADETGVAFTGIKKSSGLESIFNGTYIRSVSSNRAIPQNCALYAGTAWLFVDSMFDGHLDFLFIDEAGQVALANVIAMSLAAKNIVLVGDQMQLAQPVQGIHPEESGTSVLEYLLRDAATIPPERGIFLAETWRMAPDVCAFVSETFYDGRLAAHSDTALRRLTPPKTGNAQLSGGIVFVEALHHQCGQKSREEAEIVQALYQQMLSTVFHDGKHDWVLTPQDILIVSPYNMQVNLLQSLLPEAKVGTVDKFQGQEAPVVIFSMTTSSAKDLSRNMEFLFSRNRLNVAISRAQCLAVVVASPLLSEFPCRTMAQMRLVNTFCRLYEEAARL